MICPSTKDCIMFGYQKILLLLKGCIQKFQGSNHNFHTLFIKWNSMQSRYKTADDTIILRVKMIRGRLAEAEKDILTRMDKNYQQALKSRRNSKYQSKLNDRIVKSEEFIKATSNCFFHMVQDYQYIILTPEVYTNSYQSEIFERVEKFRKNVLNATRRITENLEEEPAQKERKNTESDSEGGSEAGQHAADPKKKSRKAKNSKIPLQQSWKLTRWLMLHFDGPYPTALDKDELSRQTGLSEGKVTNWFINARERDWKNYFPK